MGSKNKLKRFRDNASFKNVIQPERDEVLRGDFELRNRWESFFGNANPIVLELGCGKGEYTLALSEQNPDKNYIGVDIKGARIWSGAKAALEDNRSNVCFLRSQIELIDLLFGPGEVSEIWITFPDPQIKYKRTKHRMTNLKFIEKYKHILAKDGIVHLKTDSEFMHGYTLGILHASEIPVIYSNHDIYNNGGAPEEVLRTQTYYESQYLEQDKPITYLSFRFNPE
ncbi:tRNA (guanosine(46)-N7)-methyltransferase TrmB [Robiginitalea aurantiaca]|uniref:tRNA (guanine-N(7)-)-methyltransferase n=1 Tax=Robiginitalea aurantiaca TaxID=3056915 RepID=A0ABT7WEZ6_9FLAO|nr:tRNA (guanosine(46)-N7)-methyltransferase TrmB [Robiginitalea aurantiaca]MDM9631389.1 tRNA (guanosine(46)-N7)-methyltransferase TrmB [Robiginitalea aurantiaca]